LLRPLQTFPHPLQFAISLKQETAVLTHGRDHDLRYVAPVRIARGPTRAPTAGSGTNLDITKAKVRGGCQGVPGCEHKGRGRIMDS
jgi:hypothetical protein